MSPNIRLFSGSHPLTHIVEPPIHFLCLRDALQAAVDGGAGRPHNHSDIQASHHLRRGRPHPVGRKTNAQGESHGGWDDKVERPPFLPLLHNPLCDGPETNNFRRRREVTLMESHRVHVLLVWEQ